VNKLGIVLLALAACQNTASQLEGKVSSSAKGEGANTELIARIKRLDERLAKFESLHAPSPGTGSTLERMHRLEVGLGRREEALGFLEMAYGQQKTQQEQKEANEADPEGVFAVDVSGPVKAGQTEGPAGAAVTIVKAFDFACPYCEKLNTPLHELVKEYAGKVRVVYMNLVVHPDTAQLPHQYSCAAAKQGKYLAWKDAFWTKGFNVYAQSGGKERAAMGEDNILKLSGEAGLDVQKLKADASSDECKKRVEEDGVELRKFRVSGTPALFINGKFIGGAIPKEAFKQIIDQKLAVVDASKVPAAEYYAKEIMGKGLRQFRSKKEAAQQKAAAEQPGPAQNNAQPAGAGSAAKPGAAQ
jgi:protein-disulfide isomerase